MSRPARLLNPHPRPDAGVTLVELLMGLVISALLAPLIWNVIHGGIRFNEATTWQTQLQRDLDRLTTLLDAEAEEACLFSTAAAPDACEEEAPVCASAADLLTMRVTLLDDNNVPTDADAVITYTRNPKTNELLRTGPRILNTGRLDPANTPADDQLVMRDVTGFSVTPNDDCGTATLQITVQSVAASAFAGSNPVTLGPRTFGLRTGSRRFVD